MKVVVAVEQLVDDDGIEGHDAFVARPQREHGRRYGFSRLLDAQ